MGYEIGARVGDYEVLAVLGAGGMGQVYKVRNLISDRVEAMKILLPNLEGDPDLADRFVREIKVQASLDHPNIAALHTALRVDNQLVMLMEYVEGQTLEDMLKQGPIPVDKAVDYMTQVLSALSYAHERGVIHRDLKPANMILTPKGVIKLMDFGIAKLAADRKLTQTGSTVGSLYYMSPEQIKGAVDLDPRSDLYSLGVSMYEIVSGARPFQGDSEYSIMVAHLEKNPVPLLQIDPKFPPALNEIVLQAIEKDPAKRFQTAAAFRNALMSLQAPKAPVPSPVVQPPPAPSKAPTPAPMVQAAPPAPRSRRGLYIAIGSLATIAVLIAAATQIPKFRQASAQGGQPAAVAPPAAEVVTPQPGNLQTAPANETPAAVPVPAAAPASTPAPSPSSAAAPATRSAPRREEQQRPAAQPVQMPVQSAPVQAAPQPVQQQPPAPSQPAVDTAKVAQLQGVREQFVLLATRANAIKASIDTLKREQARQGLGLRQDIAAGLQRMEFYLDETEAALKRSDAAASSKNLSAAEREVSKLETFMGR